MRHAVTILRMLLAISMLLLIGWQFANWQQVADILSHTAPIYLVGCVLIYVVGVAISSYKWQLLLQTQGHAVPFWRLFSWYLLGAFAGNLLPSSIGGDLGRGVVAGRSLAAPIDAWVSIIAERLTGLAMLVFLALLVLLFAPQRFGWSFGPTLIVITGAMLIGVLVVYALWWLMRREQRPAWLIRQVERFSTVITCYRNQPQVFLQALGLSLMFHGLNCLSLWLTARAVAPNAPLAVGLAYPLIDLAGLVPLTPGGLGIREGATTVLLQRVGLTTNSALAVAVVSRTLLWLVSLSGLPVFLAELRTPTMREGL